MSSLETEIADAVRDYISGECLDTPMNAIEDYEVVTAGKMPAIDTVIRDWLPAYELKETNKVRISVIVAGTETVPLGRAVMQDRTKIVLVTQRKFGFRQDGNVTGPDRDQIDEMSQLTEELRRLFEPWREIVAGTHWDSVEDSIAFEQDDMQYMHQYTSVLEHNFRTVRAAAA